MEDADRLLGGRLGHSRIIPANAVIKFVAENVLVYLKGLENGVPISERGRKHLNNLGILISQAESAVEVLISMNMAGYRREDMDCYAAMGKAGWYSTPREAGEVLTSAKEELETALRGGKSPDRLTKLVNDLRRIPTEEPTDSRGWRSLHAISA